jgi:hypothetical protein
MTPRVLRGFRFLVLIVGLNLMGAGVIWVGSYIMLREPPASDQAFDDKLAYVTYAVPSWLIRGGWLLIAAGMLVVVAGWFTSPRWNGTDIRRQTSHVRGIFASFGCTGLLALVVAFVAGRRSPETQELYGLIAVCSPVCIWLLWKEFRASRK